MVDKQLITAPGYKGGLGGRAWSPGLKVGPWLFLSGITSVDYDKGATVGRGEPRSMTPGEIDPVAQWRQVLSNIKSVVEGAGGTMADVVMANVFVTDMHFYYQYEWVRKEFFEEPYPVCTAVEVGSLVHPDWILEIECIAYLGDGS
jgi:enamine deaminase RidA (YjgF/YER057c/UK114 family)